MLNFHEITPPEYSAYLGAEPFTTGELPFYAEIETGNDEYWDAVVDRFGIEVHNCVTGDNFRPSPVIREYSYAEALALTERVNRDPNFIANVRKYWQPI